MFRSIACLIFILTNSVLAQAAFEPIDNGSVRLQTQNWVPTYAGETEIDGLPVIANLEEIQIDSQIPEYSAKVGDTFVPSLLPVIERSMRLNLIVSNNPQIHAIYEIQPRVISIDGVLHNSLTSNFDDERGFQFVATKQENGTIHVTYTRKVTGGNTVQGEFDLSPVPHIF